MTEPGLELLKLAGRRHELLERVVDEPLEKRDLEAELDASRSTVDRAVKELEEAGLVRWTGDGHRATLAGRLLVQLYREYVDRSSEMLAATDVLARLPPDSPIEPELLADSDVHGTEDPSPYELYEPMQSLLESAGEVTMAVSAAMEPEALREVRDALDAGSVTAHTFMDAALVETLEAQFPGILAGFAAGDSRVYETAVEGFGLLYAHDRGEVAVGVATEDGRPAGVITNDTAEATLWAERFVEGLREDATEVTAEARGRARVRGDRRRLEAEGFVELTEEYLDRREPAPLTTGWRTGLDLVEVAAGHALERERSTDDGRRSVVTAVTDRLADGADVAVLGPAGSGKSTVCKHVACRWHDDGRGPVLYRKSGRGEPFEAWPLLVEALRASEGHALVVVEDAVRAEASEAFRAMSELRGREDVSFLLDARDDEWSDPPSFPVDARLESYRANEVETVTMPALDEREVERFVERFEAATGHEVASDPGWLLSAVRDEEAEQASPAALQLLSHRLSLRADPLTTGAMGTPTTLVEEARRTVLDLEAAGDLALAVGALANLLNAAGLGVRRTYLHALAPAFEGRSVEGALDLLEGRVLFPDGDGYRTVHPSWSTQFLDVLRRELGEERARSLVGDALTALFALADDGDRRDAAATAAGTDPPAGLVEAPREWVAETVERVFAVGTAYPGLAPLYGHSDDPAVDLPAACPAAGRADVARLRGEMYLEAGALDRAAAEFEALRERAADLEHEQADRLWAAAASKLGTVAFRRGDVEVAERRYEAALSAAEERGDRRRVADNREKLGDVARRRSNYDAAEEHYRAALATYRDLDDPLGAASARHNLGNVAAVRGDAEAAEEHYRAALATYREAGNRGDETDCLNDLGTLAENRGDLGTATEYYRECHERYRAVGDRVGEANALANLGLAFAKRGTLDRAERYATRALERSREVGDRQGEAYVHGALADVEFKRGDQESARDHAREAIAIHRDLGDRGREALNLARLGRIAAARGDEGAAAEHARQAMELARELGDQRAHGAARLGLGKAARERGDADDAEEHLTAALSIARELGDQHGEGRTLTALGALALDRDDPATATDRLEAAVELLTAADSTRAAVIALARLATAYERAGDPDAAGAAVDRARTLVTRADLEALPDRLTGD